MDVFEIVVILIILWGVATLLVGLVKPAFVWNNSKLQGFVQLFGETGTTIFLAVVGLAALAGGIWLYTKL